MRLFKNKLIPEIFILTLAITITSCGGGDSDSSGISNNPNGSTVVTRGVSSLVTWPFIDSADYAYDIAAIQVLNDMVSLLAADQTDDDNDSMGFGGGVSGNTIWDNNCLALSPGAPPFDVSGEFTSRIMDAGASTSWSALSWTPQRPYYKELPDNAQTETGYAEGNADMTDIVLLMHMNETGGSIIDYSGNGNNGTVYDTVNYGANGVFNTSVNFEDGYAEITSLSVASSSDVTFTAWIKTTAQGTISALGGTSFPGYGVSGGHIIANNNKGNIYESGSSIVNDGTWHFAAAVIGSSGIKVYADGVPDSASGASFDSSGNNYARVGLGTGYQWGSFVDGTLDEVAVYNRALSDTEILDLYKRGAVRLKFQVRSCDDPSCDQEQFAGPDGTTATFFSELNNMTAGPPSSALNNVPDNRYFQYKTFFETDDVSYSPELKNVVIGPVHYPGDNPTIVNNTGQPYSSLNSFTERLGNNNQGEVRYQISNNGADWYYHDGLNWESAAGYSETNSADEVNIYLWAFPDQVGSGTFYFKAFLHSDTTQRVEMDCIYLSYTN